MSDDGTQDTYDSTSYSYDTGASCYDTTTTTAHDYSSTTTTTHDYSSSKDNDNDYNSGRHTTCEATERTYNFNPPNDNDNDNSGRHHTAHETTERAHGSMPKNHTPILERRQPTIRSSSSNEAVDSDDVTRECIDSEPPYVYDTQDADFTSVAFDDFDSESVDLRTDRSSRKKRNNLIKETDIENKKTSQNEDEGCCKCWNKSWKCLATFCDCFGL